MNVKEKTLGQLVSELKPEIANKVLAYSEQFDTPVNMTLGEAINRSIKSLSSLPKIIIDVYEEQINNEDPHETAVKCLFPFDASEEGQPYWEDICANITDYVI